MGGWSLIVEGEAVASKRKNRNVGVRRHVSQRIRNLVEIQQNVLNRTMRTSEYKHEQRVSGQEKVRDIAKLCFHPSHIQHQLLTLVAERRIDRALIHHTYASRKGYGQTRAAMQIRRNIRRGKDVYMWYGQGDICKYYDSMPHALLRGNLCRLFKDDEFINAFMEPFERFSSTGKSIPLGIRPSQLAGNVGLMTLDRLATEELHCYGYVRYLDDFVFLGKTKGEVKRKMKAIRSHVESLGFKMHEPKIRRVSEGLDMMGFVFYGIRNDMFWRKADKRRWLRRRSKVTNPRRLRELDDAAWGMLKWGNTHCKRLFHKKTGIRRQFKENNDMGVKLSCTGMIRTERSDKNGIPFIEAPNIAMSVVLGKPVEVKRVVKGLHTAHGGGRYALLISFMGDDYKLIVNAVGIKTFLDDMERNGVTRVKTVFIDHGSNRYDVDADRTELLEVNGLPIEECDGKIVFTHTKEEITFK